MVAHRIRERFKLSQVQLAQLMGVHPITISKWEREECAPTPYQRALMHVIERGDTAFDVATNMLTAGVPSTLGYLLYTGSER